MSLEDLKIKLEERLRRLTEDFKEYAVIQEHGVPEIRWVLEEVNKLIKENG